MSLDDLKSFINILLHILVVDQMLLELLSKLGRQCLDAIRLLLNLLADLEDLLIDVLGQEVSPLGRVLGCLLHVLGKLLDGDLSELLVLIELQHHITYEALVQILRLFVGLQP